MLRAVIVEDEFVIANYLNNILINLNVKVIEIVDNIADAKVLIELKPDFFLLDIRLFKNDSGLDLGKILHKQNIPFIYISANNEIEILKQAVATFPKTYISKPFNERDIIAAIEILKLSLNDNYFIKIITHKGKQIIHEKNILYCEGYGSYVKIYTENGVITQRITLKEIESKLSYSFLRIHRSFIVNSKKISYRKSSSLFIGQKEIVVSRYYKKNLLRF